jgi:hypothetical protein
VSRLKEKTFTIVLPSKTAVPGTEYTVADIKEVSHETTAMGYQDQSHDRRAGPPGQACG